MNDLTLPIACALTDAEFREREKTVLRKVRKIVLERKELASGYAYRISGDDESLREIAELVLLERRCCPFLEFKIIVKPGGEVWLELTGAGGAKEFIAATF